MDAVKVEILLLWFSIILMAIWFISHLEGHRKEER